MSKCKTNRYARKAKPYYAPGHLLTIQLLDRLIPGKRVRNFSLHFPMHGQAYMVAEIVLDEGDASELVSLMHKHGLYVGDYQPTMERQQELFSEPPDIPPKTIVHAPSIEAGVTYG